MNSPLRRTTVRMRARLRGAFTLLGADWTLVAVFLAALAALIAVYGTSFKWTEGPITIAGGTCLGLLAVPVAARLPGILRRDANALRLAGTTARGTLRDWAPFVVIMWAFESLESYTGIIRKEPIDDWLYRTDVRLFGVEPTVWVGKLSHPLLTDWMAFAYGSYFVMPMILAAALSLRGRREDFREMSSAVVLQMGIGFVLFLFFPAGPPRFYEPLLKGGFEPARLHSYFGLYEFQQGSFDTADPLRTRSAFPSLHCSLALLTLFFAWRFGSAVWPNRPRFYFWLCLPICVSLWLSTIYLRHHWIPDCLAGFALGFVAEACARGLRRWWPRTAGVQASPSDAPSLAPSSASSDGEAALSPIADE